MRSFRWAKILSALAAGAAVYLVERAFERWTGGYLWGFPEVVAIIVLASYVFLPVGRRVGRFDPVVAWALSAWRRAGYPSALRRFRIFPWGSNRAPFKAFLLTSANLPNEAYIVATNATLPESDVADPAYDLDFASGRAALAQGNLDGARHHFDRLYGRLPGSALARYAVGDLLLWQNAEPERAHQLLTGALADPDRFSLPHWTRLGFEAELRASHAWSLASMQKGEGLQYSFDQALRLAGHNSPVQAAVHLRLGNALRALKHFTTARQHWRAASEVDPHGWAGCQAARELKRHPSGNE